MRTYSNPAMQEIVTGMYANIESANSIIANMKATVSQQRRSTDTVTEITPEQSARMVANQGKHIYGPSHPKYVGA